MPLASNRPTRIGIAIVLHRQQVLVGIRSSDQVLAGAAEFPGGKCLDGETAAACAIRECLEETGLLIDIDELLDQREWTYPHGRVDLSFFLCHPVSPSEADALLEFRGFRWTPVADLFCYFFAEANQQVVDMLIDRYGLKRGDSAIV
ncbi:MAG: NUDIX domain-containing protein [Planctomycetaceae bacterium]